MYDRKNNTNEKKRASNWIGCFVGSLSFLFISYNTFALPPERPLWENAPQEKTADIEEQLRTYDANPESPSGLNRVYSSVSIPTYSIHRPENPNGVGIVICPGGGFCDVWIDREGHDLALWLKERGVTSLVLKYRTILPNGDSSEKSRRDYLAKVEADGWQAIRILRSQASELKLDPDKIGICGFSAGGYLSLNCSIKIQSEKDKESISGAPNFAGLFYPGIPDDVSDLIESRLADYKDKPICPLFIMNGRPDNTTPAKKCVDFYSKLLNAGVNAELHIFGKGSHGFDLGFGRGQSVSLWTNAFIAWLKDIKMISSE